MIVAAVAVAFAFPEVKISSFGANLNNAWSRRINL